jgi:REP element-mobilizing transposase RayT
MQQQPLAYFISFRCYGTWLRGDERGWCPRRGDAPASTYAEGAAGLREHDRALLKHAPVRLSAEARAVVDAALVDLCVDRGWELYEHAVNEEHVHAMLNAEDPPERVLVAMKAWATRRLREAGISPDGARVWSAHGSTEYLWTELSVERVRRYIARQRPEARQSTGVA